MKNSPIKNRALLYGKRVLNNIFVYNLNLHIYPINIVLIIGDFLSNSKDKDILKNVGSVKELLENIKDFSFEGLVWNESIEGKVFVFIDINKKHKSYSNWFGLKTYSGLFAHEAMHIVNILKKDFGLGELNDETNEFYAYLIGFLTDFISYGFNESKGN